MTGDQIIVESRLRLELHLGGMPLGREEEIRTVLDVFDALRQAKELLAKATEFDMGDGIIIEHQAQNDGWALLGPTQQGTRGYYRKSLGFFPTRDATLDAYALTRERENGDGKK